MKIRFYSIEQSNGSYDSHTGGGRPVTLITAMQSLSHDGDNKVIKVICWRQHRFKQVCCFQNEDNRNITEYFQSCFSHTRWNPESLEPYTNVVLLDIPNDIKELFQKSAGYNSDNSKTGQNLHWLKQVHQKWLYHHRPTATVAMVNLEYCTGTS